MKELSIEGKATRYDKVVNKLRRFMEQGIDPLITRADVQDFFPELMELEDERIRKELIAMVKLSCTNGDDVDKKIAWLEKQGGQKPADKVEPKFHEGEWVVFNEHHNSVYQVEKIDNYRYYLRHYLGGTLSVHFDNELIRPWTIQDAKDGDVLVTEDWVFIFKKMNSNGKPVCYCHYDIELGFRIDTNSYMASGSEIYPATKEQRDLLFQKMKEAGYEWDAEKKELKKIEQKPVGFNIGHEITVNGQVCRVVAVDKDAWSEEDENLLNRCIINTQMVDSDDTLKIWLKSLKERVQPQPKQDWSQNDIEYVRTDAFIEKACEFISLNVTDYINVTYKGGIEQLALQERFIDAFRKYMEGE